MVSKWRYGALLVVSSFVLAMLLFARALPSTFFLCFLVFATSTFGTILGMVGAVYVVKFEREARHEEYE